MIVTNIREFHESTCKELIATKNRVRNLIGDRNWNDEGHYKETILANIIKRVLPKNYGIGSGHIVKKGNSGYDYEVSSQIDIIIYDNILPLLFTEGNFVITTPAAVRAIIEVKTNIGHVSMRDTIRKANECGNFIFYGQGTSRKKIFNGIFSYECTNNNALNNLDSILRESFNLYTENPSEIYEFVVNHICIDEDRFIKYWRGGPRRYSLYNIQNLSFSFFIGHLMYFIIKNDFAIEKDTSIWFPINKELHKVWDSEI